jgi:hypothetical protein
MILNSLCYLRALCASVVNNIFPHADLKFIHYAVLFTLASNA